MKVRSVQFDNRRQSFHVTVGSRVLELPYAAMDRTRGRLKVVRAFPDPEMGYEGFAFELDTGEIDGVHVDNVLLVNGDPRAVRENTLHNLIAASLDAPAESGVSKRSLARRLGTSMSQLARLLDPTNRTKSIEQMMSLLRALGRDVEVVVKKRSPVAAA